MNLPTGRIEREERRKQDRAAAKALHMWATIVCAVGNCPRCLAGPETCLCTCHDLSEERA